MAVRRALAPFIHRVRGALAPIYRKTHSRARADALLIVALVLFRDTMPLTWNRKNSRQTMTRGRPKLKNDGRSREDGNDALVGSLMFLFFFFSGDKVNLRPNIIVPININFFYMDSGRK